MDQETVTRQQSQSASPSFGMRPDLAERCRQVVEPEVNSAPASDRIAVV